MEGQQRDQWKEFTVYAEAGESVTHALVERSGRVLGSTSTYWANLASLILPMLAMVAFLIAVAHKMIRTGSMFNWQMIKHEWDPLERILVLYSLPILIVGAFGPLVF